MHDQLKNPKGGPHEKNENQNWPRNLILAVVNSMGTQSIHANFWENSLLGTSKLTGTIQTQYKMIKPFYFNANLFIKNNAINQ